MLLILQCIVTVNVNSRLLLPVAVAGKSRDDETVHRLCVTVCMFISTSKTFGGWGHQELPLQLDPVYSSLQKYSPLMIFGTFCCAIRLFHNTSEVLYKTRLKQNHNNIHYIIFIYFCHSGVILKKICGGVSNWYLFTMCVSFWESVSLLSVMIFNWEFLKY